MSSSDSGASKTWNVASACQGDFPQRATKDIIWSCLITIFACALVSLHPNLPERGEKSQKAAFRRLELMFWALVAPEMMVFWAIRQWTGARSLAKEYNEKGWTMSHGHFLQMGGFMLFEGKEAKGTLTPERFRELLASKRINLPSITAAEIEDLSKKDTFFRALATFQSAWLVVQSIARLAQGFALTPFELITTTVALASGVMYFLWWDKPLNVRCSVPVFLLNETKDEVPLKVDGYVEWFDGTEPQTISPITTIYKRFHEMTDSPTNSSITSERMRVPTFYAVQPDAAEETPEKVAIASGIAVIFGAIYCLGWVPGSLTFPTHEDGILWKVCSMIIPATLTIMLLDLSGAYPTKPSLKRKLFDVYVVARIILLLESLVAFRQLPPMAFVVLKWTSYLPHV